METHTIDNCTYMTEADGIDRLEARLQSQLNGRVRDLHLLVAGQGLILRGHAHTYYAKQIAQHVVMDATELPIVANEIEVS
jgi:hypothetical protein